MKSVSSKTNQDTNMRVSTEQQPIEPKSLPLSARIYENSGNPLVIDQIDSGCRRVLDVGCGAGDNARLLKARLPDCEVFGITQSETEAERARTYMTRCWVGDIEDEIPNYLEQERFDCIVFSHVLEHLRNPADVVGRMSTLLRTGGQVVIAVPNVMFINMRLQFLRGDFQYNPEGGILDDTHLHFYSYFTADRYLLTGSPDLRLTKKLVSGYIPQPLLRGRVIPHAMAQAIDRWGLRLWPNLFGYQIVIAAAKV
jgi:2-polyprenyl-3-methyl-5-hydroxy-6-metoxy-1,4-benzoquinol methylase